MKYLFPLLIVGCLLACTREVMRPAGKPFPGYSCQESLIHFYSNCSKEKLTKEVFEAKVKSCEDELATKICDKELAALLWCLGRVEPGTPHVMFIPVGGQGSGCDCSFYRGALKECQMKNGIFK